MLEVSSKKILGSFRLKKRGAHYNISILSSLVRKNTCITFGSQSYKTPFRFFLPAQITWGKTINMEPKMQL
jgi:hypothetical protein